MRTRYVCWGVVLMAFMAGKGLAQPTSYPAEMTVVVPEVEVRSGPGLKFYPTSKLGQGQRINVLKLADQPGWVAITPPLGSFTWIREKYVKKLTPRIGQVQAPDNSATTTKPGSSLFEGALNVEKEKVPSGCQVVIMDDKLFDWQGEKWMPIQPTPGEVRYLPLIALRAPSAPVQVASGFPTTVGGDPLTRGDQARAAGNVELARQFYRQAADTMPEPKKSEASNKWSSLPPAPAGTAAVAATHSNWQPVVPLGANQTQPPPLGSAQQAGGSSTQSISNHSVPRPTMTAVQLAQWSSWGYLRRAGFEKDGQTVYVLEDNKKQPVIYAVEKANAVPVLERLIGRPVCLYGPIQYRSEDFPRINYMVVTHLQWLALAVSRK